MCGTNHSKVASSSSFAHVPELNFNKQAYMEGLEEKNQKMIQQMLETNNHQQSKKENGYFTFEEGFDTKYVTITKDQIENSKHSSIV
jgi:hypothetical protein